MTERILFFLAVLPAIVIAIYVFKKDKIEKEPKGLLIMLFLFGAASVFVASFIENILIKYFYVFENLAGGDFPKYILDLLYYIIGVGFVEEGVKWVITMKVGWRSKEFNSFFDIIVYAVFVSLGFATLENIFYVFQYGFSTAILRMLTAVPSHAMNTVFMGIFLIRAKVCVFNNDASGFRREKALALLVPTIIHGLYDFVATLESDFSLIVLIGFLAVEYLTTVYLIKKYSKEDYQFSGFPDIFYTDT